MPKLFSRKKSKKAKFRIRDALAPSSAFIAVPNTPPPSTPGNQSNQFTFPANPPPLPATPVRPVSSTSQTGTQSGSLVPLPQLSTVSQELASQDGDIGAYCLAGPAGEMSDEDEPGYATVRTSPYRRPRLPSPLNVSSQLPTSGKERLLSTSELPSVTSALSVHSESSDESYQLDPPPMTEGEFPYHNPAAVSADQQSFIEQSPKPKSNESQLNEQEKESLYSKVNKRKKSSKVKTDVTLSANRSPNGSPPEPRQKSKHLVPNGSTPEPRQKSKHLVPNRSTPEPKQKSKQQISSHHVRVTVSKSVDSPKRKHHKQHPSGHDRKTKYQVDSQNPRDNHSLDHSQTDGHRDLHSEQSGSHNANRQKSPKRVKHRSPPDQYDDENSEYLHSCEESDSSLESYSDEEAPDSYQVNEIPRRNRHYLSNSVNLPSHRPPVSKHPRPSSQGSHYRRKSTGAIIDGPSNKQAFTNAPYMEAPAGIQSQRDVFVFSEQLPDGSLQYYSATPVQTPTPHTPPLITHPHSTPAAHIHPNHHTPTPHTPPLITHPHSTPASHVHHTPNSFHTVHHSDGNQTSTVKGANMKLPVNLTESGYFSNTTLGANSHPISTNANKRPGSVIIGSMPSQGSATLITPLDRQSPGHVSTGTNEPRLSPRVKLLESSLQRASQSSSPSLSPPFATRTPQFASSPLPPRSTSPQSKANGRSTPTKVSRNDRSSPTKVSQDSYQAQYDHKQEARLEELEALNREISLENVSLRQNYELLKSESSSSSELLQSKMSALLSENNTLRQTVRNKDSKLGHQETDIAQLKSELLALTDENKALLTNQHACLEERGEWEAVAAHAHSVLDENTSLVKSRDLQRETIRELKGEHQAIVSQMNGEIAKLHKERSAVEGTLNSLRQSHTNLSIKFDQLSAQSAKHVPIEEHQQVLMEMQRLVEELDENNERQLRSQEAQIRISDKDKRSLVAKLTDAKAIIFQLESEVAQLHKAHRKAHEKVFELQHDLELARDREVTIHSQLSRAVMFAEKASSERDTFAKIAKSQEVAKERAVMHGVKTAGKLERKLESQKYNQLERASAVLHEQDRDHKHQRGQYRQEISHLKSLLTKKQSHVDKLIKNSR